MGIKECQGGSVSSYGAIGNGGQMQVEIEQKRAPVIALRKICSDNKMA
jgi:hypothetical protein